MAVCPANPNHGRVGKRLGNLHVILSDVALNDFVWSSYSDCLVQDEAWNKLSRNNFTGINVKTVEIRRNPPSDLPTPILWEVEVNGWAGLASSQSGIHQIERCPVCGFQTYTMFTNPSRLIEEKDWDGSDFFLVWPLPFFFVTERAASFFREERFTGIDIIEPDQISFYPLIKGFGPVPLRHRFPEERARMLGEPLGIY